MNMRNKFVASGCGLLVATAGAVAADVWPDEATFLTGIQPDFYLETFDLPGGGSLLLGMSVDFGPVNGYAYNMSSTDDLYLWGMDYSGMASDTIGTNGPNHTVVITFTGAPVTAVGGHFFLTDINFQPVPGGFITLELDDGTVAIVEDPYVTDFRGFTSDVPIISLTIIPGHNSGANAYVTIDNLYVGTAAGGGCVADINGDEVVDVLDLLAVLAAWGATSGPEDINGDGIVDVLDLLDLLANWGPCPVDPMGACCTPDGSCTDSTEIDCILAGGEWFEGEECATFTCPALPTGACCIADQCIGTNLLWDCDLAGGTWYEGDDCATFICPLIYCDASGGCEEHISVVQVGTINNATSCTSYGDYTTMSTSIAVGQTQTCTVTNGDPIWPTDEFGAWADWNHDGDFDDAGETIVASIAGVGPYVFDITPPAGSYIGNVTMRLRITYSMPPAPCGDDTFGEVEDYTITVTP